LSLLDGLIGKNVRPAYFKHRAMEKHWY